MDPDAASASPPTRRPKRGNGRVKSPKNRAAWLYALRTTCSVAEACRHTKLASSVMYDWRYKDPQFAQEWDAALVEAADVVLESEAVRRAHRGVLEPVFQGGKRVGAIRKYSDTLLMFLLNGKKSHIYQRMRVEHTGRNGGALEVKDVGLVEAARRVAFLLRFGAQEVQKQAQLPSKGETYGHEA